MRGKKSCIFLSSNFSENAEAISVEKRLFKAIFPAMEIHVVCPSPFVHEEGTAGVFKTMSVFFLGHTGRFPS